MILEDLFRDCAETTKAKGFDVSKHTIQMCLIATEVGEALELLCGPTDPEIDIFAWTLRDESQAFEAYRKTAVDAQDFSRIGDMEPFLEELADIQIRLASYVGGNGLTDDFIRVLVAKRDKNKERPMLHGKGF